MICNIILSVACPLFWKYFLTLCNDSNYDVHLARAGTADKHDKGKLNYKDFVNYWDFVTKSDFTLLK
jgi:hypothetical protein